MTAQVTIFKDPNITVQVFDGNPPADQSAQVAQLTADLAARTTERDTANQTIATLTAAIALARTRAQADKDADAASVAGQGVLDALPQ